jgi:cell division transport system permease protein
MIMRGISLFIKYLSENTLAILALTALFAAFHLIFLSGGALNSYTKNASRFDVMRVYARDFSPLILEQLSSAEEVENIEKIYSPAETREYMALSASFTDSFEPLPIEFFPSFAELKIKAEYRSYNSLKNLANELSAINGVDSVSFGEKWIEGFARLRFSVEALLALCSAIFAAAGGIIIYQTITVSLFRYRREVRIYAVVGGTRTFIIVPFVVAAACISLICFAFSTLAFYLLAKLIRPVVVQMVDIPFSPTPCYWCIFALLSLIISMFAGFISSRHFLNHRLS